MPRRPAEVSPDVPLFLVPRLIQQRIRLYGDGVERVTVKKTHRHFYTVSIRTRPVKREFRDGQAVVSGRRTGKK